MKHTPGPWRIENRRAIYGLKAKQICEVPCYGVIHGKVDEANARLIVRAPELLSLLQDFVAEHDGRSVASPCSCRHCEAARHLFEQIRGEGSR